MGCFLNSTTEVEFGFDAEKILYVDFSTKEVIYTVPTFIDPYPSQLVPGMSILSDALINERMCLLITTIAATEERNPPEDRGKLTPTVHLSQSHSIKH